MTAAMLQHLSRHILVALVVAFGLSVLFWLVFDTFVLTGFVVWSIVSAAVGAGLGAFVLRHLAWTAAVTAIVRIAIYVVMTQV